MGEKAVPHNDVVYKLRERMLTASDGENSPALETVILEEINVRPEDVKLRVCVFVFLEGGGGNFVASNDYFKLLDSPNYHVPKDGTNQRGLQIML